MSLEQHLLKTPPPRRLRGSLINDSPTGGQLQGIALFQLVCLAVAPLSYALPAATRRSLNDFLPFLDPPALWLGLWLAACVALLFYSRYLRRRFWLAEQAQVMQGQLLDVRSETYTVWAFYSVVRLERFTFTVELPSGTVHSFTQDGQTPGHMVSAVAPGEAVTVLVHPRKTALLGLESLDNSCVLLVRQQPTYGKKTALLGCAAFISGIVFLLYTMECCVILDPVWEAVKWPCLVAGLAGAVGLMAVRRRNGWQMATWLAVLGGALFGVLALLGTGLVVNCWLDFAPAEWREARVVNRRSKNLSHQVPIQIGELTLSLDGQRFDYPCRPSRLYAYPETVQVRVNRGLLGYRWAGDVRY